MSLKYFGYCVFLILFSINSMPYAACVGDRSPLISDWCLKGHPKEHSDCPGYAEGQEKFKETISKLSSPEEKVRLYLEEGFQYSMDVLGNLDDDEVATAATVIFPTLDLEGNPLLRDTTVTLFSRLCSKISVDYLWRYSHAALETDPLSAGVALKSLEKIDRKNPGAPNLRAKVQEAWERSLVAGFPSEIFTEKNLVEILTNVGDDKVRLRFEKRQSEIEKEIKKNITTHEEEARLLFYAVQKMNQAH